MDYLTRVRKLPPAPAPNDDATRVKGNLSVEMRQLTLNLMHWATANYPGSEVFGHTALSDIRLTEIYLRKVGMGGEDALVAEDESQDVLRSVPLEVEVVLEQTVRKDMLNLHGALAGTCSAQIIELATFGSLQILGFFTGNDPTGFSTNMNLNFHSSAGVGTQLRIVGTSVSASGRAMTARCEIYDKRDSRVLVSGVHTSAPFHSFAKKKTTSGGVPLSKL